MSEEPAATVTLPEMIPSSVLVSVKVTAPTGSCGGYQSTTSSATEASLSVELYPVLTMKYGANELLALNQHCQILRTRRFWDQSY